MKKINQLYKHTKKHLIMCKSHALTKEYSIHRSTNFLLTTKNFVFKSHTYKMSLETH